MPNRKSPNTNIQFAIDVAEGFYQTGVTLAKHCKKDNSERGYIWIPPGVVNFSFATELLLKAVIYYDQRKRVLGHKLYKLYQTISDSTQNRIVEAYKVFKKENEKDDSLTSYKISIRIDGKGTEDDDQKSNFDEIKNLLEIHSDSFENWRYLYEFGSEGYCYEFDYKAMDAFYKSLKVVLDGFLSAEGPKYGMKRV